MLCLLYDHHPFHVLYSIDCSFSTLSLDFYNVRDVPDNSLDATAFPSNPEPK